MSVHALRQKDGRKDGGPVRPPEKVPGAYGSFTSS